jgi:HAD superfamily hydrolase (TIGR01509 family)
MDGSPHVELVLFDLGGVLVELGGVGAMGEMAGLADEDETWRRWLECRWVRAFERGGCTPEDFAAGMVDDWALPVTADDFLASFRGWVRGPYAGAIELVDEVQARVPIGLLSNTNALHWAEHGDALSFLDRFDHRFLSFELGLLKPDRDLFDRIAQLVPPERDRVLFLDDNQINVDGARAAGFQAERAVGPGGARAALVEAGVIDVPSGT